LIDDKKGMSEKCEKLVKELKTIDKKYQDKVKTMDDRYVFSIAAYAKLWTQKAHTPQVINLCNIEYVYQINTLLKLNLHFHY
jgi:hypothetical protein